MSLPPLNDEQRRRVEAAYPMLDKLASMMAARLRRVNADDLHSVGAEALVLCASRYDPSLGCTFRSYAHHRVRGAMLDASRRALPGLRRRSRAMRKLEATQDLLERAQKSEQHDGPDPRTLEQRVAVVADLVDQATTTVLLVGSRPADPENVVDDNADIEQVVDDAKMRELVDAAIAEHCTDEERELVKAVYEEGITMQDYAQRVGCSKSTISRRHAAMVRRLAAAIRNDSS